MKNQFAFIKRIYGHEQNQVNQKFYNTKEEATIAGKNWENEITTYLGKIVGRNYEVVKIK